MMDSVASLGLPWPALFSAITRNSYLSSSNKSVTSNSVVVVAFVFSGSHRSPAPVRRSTVYPVIGVPPSVAGSFQVSLHDLAQTSETWGLPGIPGTAERKVQIPEKIATLNDT